MCWELASELLEAARGPQLRVASQAIVMTQRKRSASALIPCYSMRERRHRAASRPCRRALASANGEW